MVPSVIVFHWVTIKLMYKCTTPKVNTILYVTSFINRPQRKFKLILIALLFLKQVKTYYICQKSL